MSNQTLKSFVDLRIMHSFNNKNNQHGYYLLYHNITVSNVLQPPPRFWTLLTVWKAVVSHSSVCWRVSNIFWFPMKKAGNVEPPDNDAWRIWNKLLFWMFFWFIDVDKKTIGLSFLSHLSIILVSILLIFIMMLLPVFSFPINSMGFPAGVNIYE